MPDGPRYVVAIGFEVEDLDSKVRAKLGGLETKRFAKVDGDAKNEVAGIASKLEALSSAAAGAVGKVSDMFVGAVERAGELALHLGMLGAAAGVGLVTYGVAHLNVELEQANFALASVFKAQGYAESFAGAMGIATDQVAKMKTDVKALPGTFTELVGIMQSISIPAANAGMSVDKMRELSEKTMLFAGITGLRQDEAGAGMAQLLAGNARQTSPMARLLGFTGAAAKKLRGETGEEREKEIEKAISKYDAAREAFSHTWKAVTTAVKDDILLKLLAPATSPLFESIKGALVGIDEWFVRNDVEIGIFTSRLGEGLKSAWEWGERTFFKWLPAIQTFASDAYAEIAGIWQKVEPVIARVAESIRMALADGSALEKIESILKLYAAVKVGGEIAPIVSGAFGIGKGVAGLFGGAEAAGGAAAGGAEVIAASVMGGAALVALAGAAAGAELALKDTSYVFHTEAFNMWSHAKEDVSDATSELGIRFQSVSEKVEDVLLPSLENAGTALIGAVDIWATTMKVATDHLDTFATFLGPALLGPLGAFAPQFLSPNLHTKDDVFNPNRDYEIDPGRFLPSPDAVKKANAELKPGAGGGAGVHIGTQVNNFTVSTTSEPSRVARTIKNAIAEKSRYPTASPWVQNFSAARTFGGG